MTEVLVSSKALDTAIGRVSHAMGSDDARPILAAVLIEGDKAGLRVVAADNYRVAVADVTTDDRSPLGKCVLPRDQVPLLRTFLKGRDRMIQVTVSNERTRIDFDDMGYRSIQLPLIFGTYPNYAALLGEAPGERSAVGINPAYLAESAKALPKGQTLAVRFPKPANLNRAVLVTATGYTEIIMPIKTDLDEAAPGSETLAAA